MTIWSRQAAEQGANDLVHICHKLATAAGWWDAYNSLRPGFERTLYLAAQLGLVHSEVSEAMEGLRKGKNDDHLPDLRAFDVELADALIRICDIAGATGVDLGEAVRRKLEYNQERADHKPEVRAADGGKKF